MSERTDSVEGLLLPMGDKAGTQLTSAFSVEINYFSNISHQKLEYLSSDRHVSGAFLTTSHSDNNEAL